MADSHAKTHDLFALFSSDERDFLVRNNGDKVEISSLYGKTVGIYFSARWCDNCRRFNPELVEVYQEVASLGMLEVVFVSNDRDVESFNKHFSEMPWLAVPFTDFGTMMLIEEVFAPKTIPSLVILQPDGRVSTVNGTVIVKAHGVTGYPFTRERIKFLKETAKRNQTLSSLLGQRSRDYLLAKDGNRVPIAALEGKTVALYFAVSQCDPCMEFFDTLVNVYKALKERGAEFEVVLVPQDHTEEDFKLGIETIPWLTLPYKDITCQTLVWFFEVNLVPTLLIVGPDGKTVNTNAAEFVEEHGVDAFPFTEERVTEIAEIMREKEESQELELLLVSGNDDFVIGKDGSKVLVSELVGKNILLYFSAHQCTSFVELTPKHVIRVYHDIKAEDDAFEVIFVSTDTDESSYKKHYSEMPWLALPYGDERIERLCNILEVDGIPTAVAIDRTGRIVNEDARAFIDHHGAAAYPFTQEKLKRLEEEEDEMVQRWPQKLKHELHAHELILGRCYDGLFEEYVGLCEECNGLVIRWSFCCKPCSFDLHPKCALKRHELKPSTADPQCSDERIERLCKILEVDGIPTARAIDPTSRIVNEDARDFIEHHGAAEKLKRLEEEEDEMVQRWPQKLKHELHAHELILGRRYDGLCEEYDGLCEECNGLVIRWSFCCKLCSFDLHPKCALKRHELKPSTADPQCSYTVRYRSTA